MGALGWSHVLYQETQQFIGSPLKPLVSVRAQVDLSRVLSRAEEYTKGFDVEYDVATTRDDEELQLPRRARQERARDLLRSLHRGVRDSQAAGVETGERCLIGYLIRAASRSLRQLTAASCSATASVSATPGSSGR
jgi:hypothetical protein